MSCTQRDEHVPHSVPRMWPRSPSGRKKGHSFKAEIYEQT